MKRQVAQKHITVSPGVFNKLREDSRRNHRTMKGTIEMIVSEFYDGRRLSSDEGSHASGVGQPISTGSEV